MSQLDSVTWSPAGGSSPVNSGHSSSLPTLSRQTSSLGSEFSSPYTSGVWPSGPGKDDFTWLGQDLTSHTDQDLSWWPHLTPIEEGYTLWSDTYNSFNSSCDFSSQSFDQPPPTYNDQEFVAAFQTAQLAADLLHTNPALTSASTTSPPVNKVGIGRVKKNTKAKKGHECPDCGKVCVRPSDLLRHRQDIHALAAQYYQCEAQQCPYNTRRKDKMKEHCRKMHKHQELAEKFATVSAKDHAVKEGSPLAKRQRR